MRKYIKKFYTSFDSNNNSEYTQSGCLIKNFSFSLLPEEKIYQVSLYHNLFLNGDELYKIGIFDDDEFLKEIQLLNLKVFFENIINFNQSNNLQFDDEIYQESYTPNNFYSDPNKGDYLIIGNTSLSHNQLISEVNIRNTSKANKNFNFELICRIYPNGEDFISKFLGDTNKIFINSCVNLHIESN